MEFIEARVFSVYREDYLDDEAFLGLQNALMDEPTSGDVIPHGGGLRKLRFPDPRRNKGKRGGLRVIYFYHAERHSIWLMTVYDKNESDDLDQDTLKALREHIRKIRSTT
jgi:hypothetical protein